MKRKILIISLDGGTWKVLDLAMQAGFMPFLKNLINQGSRDILLSTQPPITPVAWASFQMGVKPGEHGIIDFSFWDSNKQKVNLVSSLYLDNTLWDKAGKKGRKIGVVNVPLTYPPKPINGYLITGFLTPDLESDFTYPADLKAELLAKIADYEILGLDKTRKYGRLTNFTPFLKEMAKMINLRTRAAEFLLNKDKFDLFMLHFQAVDIVQHPLWPYLKKPSSKQKMIFQKFYQPLDQCLRKINELFVKQAGRQALLLLISDHGFQTHKKWIMIGNLFFKHGLIDKKGRTKKRINKFIHKLGINLKLEDKSQIRIIGKSCWGTIYSQAKGKRQKAKLEERIKNLLYKIKDPDTGKRVIKAVHRKEDLYSGSRLHLLPDFLVEPMDGYSITASIEPKKGFFQKVMPGRDFHLGTHHQAAIIACSEKIVLPQKIETVAEWILERI